MTRTLVVFSVLVSAMATAEADSTAAQQVQAYGLGNCQITAFSPDNTLVAIPVLGGIQLLEAVTGERSGFLPSRGGVVTKVVFSPDGAFLAAESGLKAMPADDDVDIYSVAVWDVAGKTLLGAKPWDQNSRLGGFSADSSTIMTFTPGESGSADMVVEVWNWETGAPVNTFTLQGTMPFAVSDDLSVHRDRYGRYPLGC